jgi:heme exporter protein A
MATSADVSYHPRPVKNLHFLIYYSIAWAGWMLEVTNLSCVRGTRRLFRDLNFSAAAGELVELRGPNGSGKTSLLRILCGLSSPASGEVCWKGKNIRALAEQYFGNVAYLAHQNGLKDELSAFENLRMSSGVAGRSLPEAEAVDLLTRVGLADRLYLPARVLSAGQRRRLALARLLSLKCSLWLLDEVLTSLDDAAMQLARQFINEHLEDNGIAIIATHQDLDLSTDRVKRIQLTGV